ncbi:MAG: NAD-dependent DNA ligase LigA [Minisyncoccia bacterium]
MLNKKEAQKRIELLKKEIEKYRYAYHVLDQSLIPDEVLDSLKKELYDLEQQYPDLITPDSPTQRVGGEPLKEFKKVKHEIPMISLNDAFSEEDMRDWYERITKLIAPEDIKKLQFYCEHKFDGLAISLIYEDGIFKVGSTRGDGYTGEDVTQNLKTIESIPLRLRLEETKNEYPQFKITKQIEVRGEVLLTKKEFNRINEEQKKLGLPIYANPRNVAAGSVRQLDPKVTASRKLEFFAYDLISDVGARTHEEKHRFLQALGFKTHNKDNKLVNDLEEVFKAHDELYKMRDSLPYEIDGMVVIINDNKLFEMLGTVGKAPRGAIAYKFPPRETTTIVEDIIVQVGRTGVLTPVAILKPVNIGGVTVSKATLHNKEEIKRLGLKIGDTVIVTRAGDVIPQIEKVLPNLRSGKEKEFKMPTRCPICNTPVIEDKGGIIVYCPNKNCPARFQEKIYHFVSKNAFDIKGVGPKIINRLLDEGLIQDASDLFDLKEGDIKALERYGEKSSQNIIKSINEHKEIPLNRFLYSLSILHLGEENATILANYLQEKYFKDKPLNIINLIEIGTNLKKEDLENIHSFGKVIIQSIIDWFKDRNNIKFLQKLAKKGIILLPVSPVQSNILKGLTFVFTGELESMSRDEAKAEVKKRGGKVLESVSSKTNFVVVGKNPGSKYEKAKELKVKIINEKEFLKMLK